MKIQFIAATSRYQAYKAMPWAVRIRKVCDGYIGYESINDYYMHTHQK